MVTETVIFLQASAMSEEMSRELHHQAQEKLAHYMLRQRKDQKAKQHREALLAQVHTDVDQLLSMCLSYFGLA